MIQNLSSLAALRTAHSELSDADFLTWGRTRAVNPDAPQVIDRITFKSYLLDNQLWPKLQAAVNGAFGATAAAVASSAIAYINDPDYATVDFKSARGNALMGGLITNSVFNTGDLGAAVLALFGSAPFDTVGDVQQADLDALPRFNTIKALRTAADAEWEPANALHNQRGQKLNTLLEGGSDVPADLAALDAMGAG